MQLFYSSAIANERVYKALGKESLDIAPEKTEILKALKSRTPDNIDIQSCFGNQQIKVRTDKAVITYYLSEMMTKAYRSGKRVEELISEKHQWYIPVEDQSAKSIGAAVISQGPAVEEVEKAWRARSWSLTRWILEYKVRKEIFESAKRKEGKWHVVMVATSPIKELEFISDSNKVALVLKGAGINRPDAIKYIKGVGRFTDILYIRQGNEEYGIPLGGRPDFTGLQNGKVYMMIEIVDILEKTTEFQPHKYRMSWFEILFEYDWVFLTILIVSVIAARKHLRQWGDKK